MRIVNSDSTAEPLEDVFVGVAMSAISAARIRNSLGTGMWPWAVLPGGGPKRILAYLRYCITAV
jgi:hypothetical protein